MNKLRFFAILCLLLSLIACEDGLHRGPGGGWGNMMPYGYGGGMFVWMLLIIIVVVAFLYWAVNGAKSKGQINVEKPNDILKRRYAKGEITKDEYERMKKDLES